MGRKELAACFQDTEKDFYSWQKSNKYFGKQFSIMGDSISTLEGYKVFYSGQNCAKSGVFYMSDTWWGQVINFFGGELLVNNSWSGSRVTKLPETKFLFPSGCSDERTSALHISAVKPDVIIVCLGINDWAFGAETGNDTYVLGVDKHELFDYAYSAMVRKIKENYPHSELWCCTLSKSYMSGNADFQFPHKYGGTHIEEYNEIIRRIVRENQCSLINLYEYLPYDSLDGTHPNKRGMQALAKAVLREMVGVDGKVFLNCIDDQQAHIEMVEELNKKTDSEYVMLEIGITAILYSDTLRLTVESTSETVEFKKTEVKVGRDPECALCFEGKIYVARRQATFLYENKSWFLQDSGSINGTWLNGKRLEAWKKYQLAADDEINFANSEKAIFYKTEYSVEASGIMP